MLYRPEYDMERILAMCPDIEYTDSWNNTPLICACDPREFMTCAYSKVKTLIEHKANMEAVNNYGLTPLMVACISDGSPDGKTSSLPIVKHLIESGAKINRQDKEGCNELMLSIFFAIEGSSSIEIIEYLLSRGANMFHRNTLGEDVYEYTKRECIEHNFGFDVCKRIYKELAQQLFTMFILCCRHTSSDIDAAMIPTEILYGVYRDFHKMFSLNEK